MTQDPSSTSMQATPYNDAPGQKTTRPSPHILRGWQIAGLVLAIAVAGLLLYGFWPTLAGAEDEDRAPIEEAIEITTQVEAVVVEPAGFPLQAEATGHLMPWRRARLSAETGGVVVSRPAQEGEYVSAGELLAKLDDRDEMLALREAEAAALKAKAEYAVLTGQSSMLDSASSGDRRAVQAVMSGLTQAKQMIIRAELALARTRIVAPFSGRVANILVEDGERVAPGQELLTLLSDSRMKVQVDVLGEDLVLLETGNAAWVHVPALDEGAYEAIIEGAVYAVNPRVDAQTGTGRVTVAIPNPQGRLVAGLFAEVAVETHRLPDRLVVPAEAVLVRQGRDLVFVMEGGRAQWTYVEVGERAGNHVVITSGIQPGDTIAVTGHYTLAHDAPVEVTDILPPFDG